MTRPSIFTILILLLNICSIHAQDAKVNGTVLITTNAKVERLGHYEFTSANGRYTFTLNAQDNTSNIATGKPKSDTTENQTSEKLKSDTANTLKIQSDSTSAKATQSGQPGHKSTTIAFDEFALETFKEVFESAVNNLDIKSDTQELDQISIQVFYQIQARLNFLDDQPLTARFILKKDYIVSYLSSNSSPYYQGSMTQFRLLHKIKDMEIEIEHGAVKNITLRATNNDENELRDFLIFKNQFPFTASSKFDSDDLSALRLFCMNCGGNERVTRFVKVGELAIVDNILENNKEDYSPYNQTFILNTGSPIKEVQKERRSKIIDIAAFTDFNGFDRDQPNGIIQIEASRRINLFTKHFLLGIKRDISTYIDFGKVVSGPDFIEKEKKRKSVYRIEFSLTKYESTILSRNFDSLYKEVNDAVKQQRVASKRSLKKLPKSLIYKDKSLVQDVSHRYPELVLEDLSRNKNDTSKKNMLARYYQIKRKKMTVQYVNILGSFEPIFRYSKIEDNNKILNIPDSSVTTNNTSVDPIEFYKYQKISLGADLNILKHSIPQTKVNIYLNSGITWYQTKLKSESSQNDNARNIDAFNYKWNLFIKFNPDGRWGCSAGAEYSKSFLLTPQYSFNSNSEMIHYKFDAFFNTNSENKLFFRYRLNNQIGGIKNSFSQIQFGYSMNIFQTSTKGSK